MSHSPWKVIELIAWLYGIVLIAIALSILATSLIIITAPFAPLILTAMVLGNSSNGRLVRYKNSIKNFLKRLSQ